MDDAREGVMCSEGHFTCSGCISNHVHHACIDELQARRGREGRVLCPKHPSECKAAPFPDVSLARHLEDQAFAEYAKSREELIEVRKDEEKDEKIKAAVEQERRRIQEVSARQQRISLVRDKIIEDVLTMSCPKGHPYLDFEGCCALHCVRCGIYFCAWCLKGSEGNQANHDHVRNCPEKPRDVDPFYPHPRPEFDKHWKARRLTGLRAALERLHDDGERRELLSGLAPQLNAHGLKL